MTQALPVPANPSMVCFREGFATCTYFPPTHCSIFRSLLFSLWIRRNRHRCGLARNVVKVTGLRYPIDARETELSIYLVSIIYRLGLNWGNSISTHPICGIMFVAIQWIKVRSGAYHKSSIRGRIYLPRSGSSFWGSLEENFPLRERALCFQSHSGASKVGNPEFMSFQEFRNVSMNVEKIEHPESKMKRK